MSNTVPAAAMSLPSPPLPAFGDTLLLRLGRYFDLLVEAERAAYDFVNDVEERLNVRERAMPEALYWQPQDDALDLPWKPSDDERRYYEKTGRARPHYRGHHVDAMRPLSFRRSIVEKTIPDPAQPDDYVLEIRMTAPRAGTVERAQEIIVAFDAWNANTDVAQLRQALVDAEAAAGVMGGKVNDVIAEISAARATTPAGMALKIRVLAWCRAEPLDYLLNPPPAAAREDVGILSSLMRDIMALQEAA